MQLRGRGERGIALIITLMTMVIVAGIGTLLFARTINEMKHSRDDAAIVQTLLLARGGANLGGAVLAGDVRDELDAIVNVRSSTTTCWSFGEGGCTDGHPTNDSVISDLTGTNSVATQLQTKIDTLLCGTTITPPGTQAIVKVRVFVTASACGETVPGNIKLPSGRFVGGDPRPSNQDYAIPFVMVSEATQADYKRNVVLQGEYRFTVGRVTFAQYALFTNHHEGKDGGPLWFTEETLFDGPVHTNENFRFFANPWFGHKITSAGCKNIGTRTNPSTYNVEEYCISSADGAYFHDSSKLKRGLGPNPSSGIHKPELAGGVDWRAEFVPLPTNAYEQAQLAQDGGLYFSGDLGKLKMWAADSSGNELASNGKGGWQAPAAYQYIEASTNPSHAQVCISQNKSGGCTKKEWQTTFDTVVTYRLNESGVLQRLDTLTTPATWQTERADFNGVVYVDGKVDRLTGPSRSSSTDSATAPPTLASFAQLTLAATDRVRITGDLKYESPPCTGSPTRQADGSVKPAICNDLSSKNVLGIYVQNDDILIGNNHKSKDIDLNAPTDVTVHGVLMSSKGVVGVEDYNHGEPRGSVNLLGGIIENQYGAFFTFNTSTGKQNTGYTRKFTYDRRMYSSVSPPYFPTIGLDKVKDVRVFSFGQREQIY